MNRLKQHFRRTPKINREFVCGSRNKKSEKKTIKECLKFANKAAGNSTTKLGAGNSMPYLQDLKFLN